MIILLSSSAVLAAPSPAPAPDADSCASTIQPLMPCLDYVRTKEDKPPSQSCWDSAKQSEQATTKEAWQAACECIKQALTLISAVDPNRIPQIPQECGISTTLPPVDRNFDCSAITLTYGRIIF